MWRELGQLVGRDRLLQSEIYGRARRKKAPFLITSARGAGKTAVLEWGFQQALDPKAWVSATLTPREMLVEICKGWQLTVLRGNSLIQPGRANVSELERAINMAGPEGSIFFDDLHAAQPKVIRRYIKPWRERFRFFATASPPLTNEDLKRVLFGFYRITLEPLGRDDRRHLADLVCRYVGSGAAPSEVAGASRGFPARIVAMACGEIEDTSPKVSGEELNLAPLGFLVLALVVAVRFLAISTGQIDLYVLAGLGMGLAIFARFFIYRGIRE